MAEALVYCALETRDSLVDSAERSVHARDVIEEHRIFRIDGQGALSVFDRVVMFPQTRKYASRKIGRSRIVRIQLEGSLHQLQAPAQLSLFFLLHSKRVVRLASKVRGLIILRTKH